MTAEAPTPEHVAARALVAAGVDWHAFWASLSHDQAAALVRAMPRAMTRWEEYAHAIDGRCLEIEWVRYTVNVEAEEDRTRMFVRAVRPSHGDVFWEIFDSNGAGAQGKSPDVEVAKAAADAWLRENGWVLL